MKKSILISAFILVSLFFSCSFVLAAEMQNAGNDVVNGVRNTVNGAENVVEDAAKGTAGAIKNMGNDVKNAAQNAGNDASNAVQNVGNDVKNGVQNAGDDMKNTANNMNNDMNQSDNNGYTATRTSAQTAGDTSMNWMSSNLWTWIIVGIIAIVIIALIWYYTSRNNK